jgi:peptide/nickel transport system substrate-binding protein
MNVARYLRKSTLRFVLFASLCINSQAMCEKAVGAALDTGSHSMLGAEYLTVAGQIGTCGGTLASSQRSEPRTLNPLVAMDGASIEIIRLLTADLIHINRYTQKPEAALASSWAVSDDGRTFTVHLRRGLRFSDGHPFDADDVLFTFRAYLDERIHAPQRDLLIVGGKPISVRKADPYTVIFTLAEPYAVAERLFDGVAILPRHLLEGTYAEGKLALAWNLNTPPTKIAGLGPFRVQRYNPGQRIVLERNPFYWKTDSRANRLPYLDGIVSVFASTPETEEVLFQEGATDVISRFDAQDFTTLEENAERGNFRVYDVGPGFEYSFLLFNLNDLPATAPRSLAEKQKWFRQTAFRRAISSTIDRDSIVRLAYAGRAYPLAVQTSPGNKAWLNPAIPRPSRSMQRSKNLLREVGFSWSPDGLLKDPAGRAVEFSIMYNSAKVQQERIATVIQQDLKELGIKINVIPMDFATLMDRVFKTFSYETTIMTLADGDADPNTEINVWPSKGTAHVWNLASNGTRESWQMEIDELMREQMVTVDVSKRKRAFDRVQQLLWEYQPVVFLVSPDILVGAANRLANFRPAVLSSYTLWNADQLFIAEQHGLGTR